MKLKIIFPHLFVILSAVALTGISHAATHSHGDNGNHEEHVSHMTRSKEAVPFRNLMKKAITVVPVLEDGTEHGTFHVSPNQSVLIPVHPETVITHFIVDDEVFDECYVNGMERKEPVASVELKSLMFGEHDEYPPHLMCGD